MKYEDAVKKLSEYGQEHVLRFYETLDEGEKEALLRQIDETDFSVISALGNEKENIKRGVITPLAAMRADEIESRKEIFREEGLAAIRAGKVAAVLLAGGMGTRLGSPDPKGMYDIGISRHVYIFQRLIENMLDVVRKAGCFFHLYVMTSEKNDEKTRAFFREHNYFGYDPAFIAFFCQDNAPTVDFNGKVLMESKGRISTSPNGNGGWMKSLERAGLLQEMHREGIQWLNTFSVDNVLQKICDPVFVGATILSGRDSGSKVVRKANPEEAIGVICSEDGRTALCEGRFRRLRILLRCNSQLSLQSACRRESHERRDDKPYRPEKDCLHRRGGQCGKTGDTERMQVRAFHFRSAERNERLPAL